MRRVFTRCFLYSFSIIGIVALAFLYEVYLGENRFSIMLNQGVISVPYNLSHVVINHRRGLYCILTGFETNTISSCVTTKGSLSRWLSKAEFQVIYYLPEGDSAQKYFANLDSLPLSIKNNKVRYGIQIEGGNSKQIFVEPLDDVYVNLKFVSDWN